MIKTDRIEKIDKTKFEKDLIGFHYLLNSMREIKKVSQTQVGHGIYSRTMMHYVQTGENVPDYKTRNRLMARLGISSEGFEDYVNYIEYDRLLKLDELAETISKKDIVKAKKLFNALTSLVDEENKIEYQMLLDMKARIGELDGIADVEIVKIYEKCVSITAADINLNENFNLLLSPVEYYLIIRMLRAKAKIAVNDVDRKELISQYKNILSHMEDSFISVVAMSKVYPMAVCGLYEICKDSIFYSDELLKELYEYSNHALDILRTSNRAYYAVQIIDIRKQMIDEIKQKKLDSQIKIGDVKTEQLWRNILQKYFSIYDIDNSFYIYEDSEIYCVSDVIRERRKLLGISRNELADGICSEKTLMRIENKKAVAQHDIVVELLEKLKVSGEYRRFEIVTKDTNTVKLLIEYKRAIDDQFSDKAEKILLELKNNLDLMYPSNRFIVGRNINIIKLRKQEITPQRYLQNMKKLLMVTIPDVNKIVANSYLTNPELMTYCVMLLHVNSKERIDYFVKKAKYYETINANRHIQLYEFMLDTVANIYGIEEKYECSTIYAKKNIELNSIHYRCHALHRCLSIVAWNMARENGDYTNKKYAMMLEECETISLFTKDINHSRYYRDRIDELNNGIDWTKA